MSALQSILANASAKPLPASMSLESETASVRLGTRQSRQRQDRSHQPIRFIQGCRNHVKIRFGSGQLEPNLAAVMGYLHQHFIIRLLGFQVQTLVTSVKSACFAS